MTVNIVLLIAGLALLTIGAEGLVRGSASLALRLGLTPLVIGLTVVAFGTSTPELFVSLYSSLGNQPDIAIGNVVGSNIFNIGLILGITALVYPINVSFQVVKQDGPIMIAGTLVFLLLIKMEALARLAGIGLITVLIAYVAFNVRASKKEVSSAIKQQFDEGIPAKSSFLLWDILFICGGLFFLVMGSRLLVTSSTSIARQFGISEAVIGLTIIAAGTSMPELATSFIAALRHQPDIAVGNIIGSNIFNIFGIIGASSIAKPLIANGITSTDLWVMAGFSIALLPLLYTELKLQRWEGGILLAGYGAYLFVLWPSS